MSNDTLLVLASNLTNLSKKCTDSEVKLKLNNLIDEINDLIIERTGI